MLASFPSHGRLARVELDNCEYEIDNVNNKSRGMKINNRKKHLLIFAKGGYLSWRVTRSLIYD